ncbi:cytochrome B [Paenibacillus swuensis]|uniref:Cytochrome c oxidase subunit 2 n=1 Tax=Paenibacillus swuensis TaxID=1178515 RepID=A0A172TF72_9BACL|nr:cytochrome c oxidase subunit II [Paenibacillus swuensis]ANE45554.1 cytochrome B [Paenibacillus swuensis]
MMNRWHYVKRLLPIFAALAILLAGCGEPDTSTLLPQGPVAQQQYDLMKLSISIMIGVVLIVFALAIYVLIRFRRRPGQTDIPVQVEGNHKLEILWTVIPILLLVVLAIPTVRTTFNLAHDYSKDPEAIKVKVTAHQFWWEFDYPELGIKTAQDLIIPTGKKIHIELVSTDVLHSFWVPSLGGKMDTNVGEGNINTMYLEAPNEGVYRGKCAELCGASHAYMDFKVRSVDEQSFDGWVSSMKASVALPADADIKEVFTKQCLSCHAVGDQGVQFAPNLTGIGSRETIAGILENNKENIKHWIDKPQEVKPGNLMPEVDLTEEELDGIAEYLSGLKSSIKQ